MTHIILCLTLCALWKKRALYHADGAHDNCSTQMHIGVKVRRSLEKSYLDMIVIKMPRGVRRGHIFESVTF